MVEARINSPISDRREADLVIYLDYGAYCLFGYYGDIRLNDQGLVFRSRWRFDLGTQISLRVCAEPETPESSPVCVDLNGIVVSCDRMYYRTLAYEIPFFFFHYHPDACYLIPFTFPPELMAHVLY